MQRLEQIALIAEGSAEINVAGSVEGHYSYKRANSTLVGTVKMKEPIYVYIFGIPFSIDFSVPIRAGYDLTANAEAQMEVTANGRGTIDYGVRYTSEAGMKWISNYTFDHSGGIQSMGYDIDATLQLYLMLALRCLWTTLVAPLLGSNHSSSLELLLHRKVRVVPMEDSLLP